jgi:hypothetical protein
LEVTKERDWMKSNNKNRKDGRGKVAGAMTFSIMTLSVMIQ